MDFTKFLKIKSQLQKFYNFNAKEERDMLYSCKIVDKKLEEDSLSETVNLKSAASLESSRSNNVSISKESLIAITHKKGDFFIEFLSIADKDITFKSSSNLKFLSRMIMKNELELQLRVSELNHEISFSEKMNHFEFQWIILRLLRILKINNQVQVKGINFKDLDILAEKQNFSGFDKILEEQKVKSKYEIEVSDHELEILKQTLNAIEVDSVKHFDLESLNTKIEQFNIRMKEDFLKLLQGGFSTEVSHFLEEITKMEDMLMKFGNALENDQKSIEEIWQGIQKIEDANHRVELRNENKKKLHDFMQKLLEQLTVDKSQEYNLTNCTYTSNSELLIVDKVLTKFVKFFKSRKRQDIKMQIIKEGNDKIKSTIELMLKNFNQNINSYIKNNRFKETFLLKNISKLKNPILSQAYSSYCNKTRGVRISLNTFLADRKFFIEKINILISGDEIENKFEIFHDCLLAISKGMRDLIFNEVSSVSELWESYFKSDILNLNLELDSDDLLEVDFIGLLKNDLLFESNKFFASLLLNSLFSCDYCIDILLNFFTAEPTFILDKKSNNYIEIEKLVTSKIFGWLNSNLKKSVKINNVFGFLFFSILSTVQDKIQKNVMEDMVLLNIKDIYEFSYNLEDTFSENINNSESLNDNLGMSRISLQETKNFIVKNMQELNYEMNDFLKNQRETIAKYNCEIRRVGIIPIVKKVCNLLRIILFCCSGIKQEYTYEICEDFISKIRSTIEKVAKNDPKYTNIVLLENYHYLNNCLKMFEEQNIISVTLSKVEKETYDMYILHSDFYIKEIFKYQYESFANYYLELTLQTSNSSFELIKMQSNFTFNNFDKKVNSFLKEFNEGLKKMAKRIEKHLCKEENLFSEMRGLLQVYLNKLLADLENFSMKCYQKKLNEELLRAAKEGLSNFKMINFSK